MQSNSHRFRLKATVVHLTLGLILSAQPFPLRTIGVNAKPGGGAINASIANANTGTGAKLNESYGKLPVSFEANLGQIDTANTVKVNIK